jgi:hypothetical protein
VIRDADGAEKMAGETGRVVPLVEDAAAAAKGPLGTAPMVMVADSPDVLAVQAALKQQNADRIVAIRVEATPEATARVLQLARDGAEAVHLVLDAHGREKNSPTPRHARDVLREIHRALVQQGIRDEITLISSGGIAQAEHMAKAIICGADLVAIDIPLLLALECRLCRECEKGQECQIALEEIEADFAVHRIENLIGAWHQQLIEVLGAMGIREVRRLRGETGRAMFFEDLERDSFGRLFGKRKC